MSGLFADKLFVIRRRKQRIQFRRILQIDLNHPSPVRIFIHLLRSVASASFVAVTVPETGA